MSILESIEHPYVVGHQRTVPIERIFIHCSATWPDMHVDAAVINQWHKQRGWAGCGYHYVIPRNAKIEGGRPLDRVGAHVAGHNRNSVGICMAGGVDRERNPENNFTDLQFSWLRMLVDALQARYAIPDERVLGHNQVAAKACPSFDVPHWVSRDTKPAPKVVELPMELTINGAVYSRTVR